MYARLFCACCALCLVPGSAFAGTIVVDFTPRGDGLIAIPTFLTMFGANLGALTNATSDGEVFDFVELNFNAGEAALSFTAEINGRATFSSICQEMPSGGQVSCVSDTGRFSVLFGAVETNPNDPFGPGLSTFEVDNLVITGDDVSPDDLEWIRPQTPEPSSLTLLTIALAGVVAIRRRRSKPSCQRA
jgi:hypothetical protein